MSTNYGLSWATGNNGLTNRYVHAKLFREEIYAGTYNYPYEGGVFVSTNNGTNWTAIIMDLLIYILRHLHVIGFKLLVQELTMGEFIYQQIMVPTGM